MERKDVGIGGISVMADGRFESVYHGDRPWHPSIGHFIPKDVEAPTVEDIAKFGYLDWKVEKIQNVDPRNFDLKQPTYGMYKVVEAGKESHKDFLGSVGRIYTPVQNSTVLGLGQKLLEQYVKDGKAKIAAAGSLEGGALCFVSFYMPEQDIVVKGDVTRLFLNMVWGHNGKIGVGFGVMTFRPECENMVLNAYAEAMRMEGKDGLGRSLKHSAGIEEKLQTLANKLSTSLDVMKGLKEKFDFLGDREISGSAELATILTDVFELKSKSKKQELTEQAQTIIRNVSATFENNINNLSSELKYTRFGVYQSITHFLNHSSTVRATTKAKAAGYDANAQRQAALITPQGKAFKLANKAMNVLLKPTII